MMMQWTAFLAVLLTVAAAGQAANRPNILIVTVDDMSADSIGAFGCQLQGTTPSIDDFAKSALKFEHAHVQVGNCMPGRNLMWSGMFSHINGVEGFRQNKTATYPVLCDLAKSAGYFAAIRGKVPHSTPYTPYAWDAILDSNDSGEKWSIKDPASYGHSTRQGIQLAKDAEKPFCLMVNISDPHKPFYSQTKGKQAKGKQKKPKEDPFVPTRVFKPHEVPVPKFLPVDNQIVRQELALYYSSVRRADDCFAAIMKALKASGEADNTFVMFFSDHGMPFPFAKTQLYNHSTHTPLLIRWPNVSMPGSIDNRHMVSAIDLVPTLLDVMQHQHPHPEKLHGRSFAPLIRGEQQAHRDHVVLQYNENAGRNRHPMRGIQTRSFLYLYNPWSDGKRKFATATTGTNTYRQMVKRASQEPSVAARLQLFDHRVLEEFYDVQQDPNCLDNRVHQSDMAANVRSLRQKLHEELVRIEDPVAELLGDVANEELRLDFMQEEDARASRAKKSKKNKTRAVALLLPAPAEEEEEEEEEEDDEEDDEEEDDEEEDEDIELARELRSMLRERFEKQTAQLEATKRRLEQVNNYFEIREELTKLEIEFEKSESIDNRKTLQKKMEKLSLSLDSNGELLELEFHMMELEGELNESDPEDEADRHEIVEAMVKSLRRVASLHKAVLTEQLAGREELAEQHEETKDSLLERNIEGGYRALELLEEYEEAEESEDTEAMEEIDEQLQRIRQRMKLSTENEKAARAQPPVQPIIVTDESLKEFQNVSLARDMAPLLRTYCFECHSNESSSGELNLEKLLTTSPIVKERRQWINVIEQTKNHVMPPEDEDQPTHDERRRLVHGLHQAVERFDYSRVRHPGYEHARRLTHREYSNTVRDLFQREFDVVDRFPDDLTATSGFDNSANSLFIQPLLMERYLSIAEAVVNAALPKEAKTETDSQTHKRIFVSRPATTKRADVYRSAEMNLKPFLLRAYRRPPTPMETKRFTQQVVDAVAGGQKFEDAMRTTLQTILITPSFLLLVEDDAKSNDKPYAVEDFPLASRLSYFLWASMPDDELLQLAKQNQLSNPDVLTAQVARMLGDPKAHSLGTAFASQWLGSQHLGVRMRLDPIDNPWCTESLMTAMREETSLFFNHLVGENRPITELVSADYTFLNEELAKLYRIQGISGKQMRLVHLKSDQRGGIFGHGSLLATTSFPYRTSPVVRGKWILDTVLGTPPPPPPPNVSELSEEVERKRKLSFREKLELHREKPNCYACHSQMDPLGFSLEGFDWFGRIRKRIHGRRIDARGELPNGTSFEGIAGLKRVIVEQRSDDLVRQVTSKMLAYALGRQLEYYDEPAIRQIIEKVNSDQGRIQTLIREVTLSYPFRYKQLESR